MRKIDVFFNEIQELISQSKCEILREELVLFFEKHKKGLDKQIGGKQIAFYFLIINLKDINSTFAAQIRQVSLDITR
ncbi:hypothetical protein [Siminovitchia fortis]|uniref:hypothetical protein n=1 Tax=Siminovitchia fortis TaxID=254758 RepID=UPI00119EC645|nr:hypothetical protein [Siminovitchia fortis]